MAGQLAAGNMSVGFGPELKDTHQIRLSDDALEHSIFLYQPMLAARQQDPAQLAAAYRDSPSLVLTIAGWQPEKGHATL
jgi:hypothetical protein